MCGRGTISRHTNANKTLAKLFQCFLGISSKFLQKALMSQILHFFWRLQLFSKDLKTMYSQAPNASFSGTCETAKHHVFQVPNGVKNTASNTSLSEDLKTMYNQAPKASFSAACETAKHHVFQVPKGVKNTASNVTF